MRKKMAVKIKEELVHLLVNIAYVIFCIALFAFCGWAVIWIKTLMEIK